ncbi:MAG: hypothetical protein IPF98_03115 [Gemmatimonadetes bacterium]|nr:hypothetical protein [Gemmatimonadota bacterium]
MSKFRLQPILSVLSAVAVVSACQPAPDGPELLAPATSAATPARASVLTPSARARYDSLPPLPTPRIGHGLVVYRNCIWAIGGEITWGDAPTNAVDRYCPDIDPTRWHSAPPLAEAAAHFGGVAVIGDRIYVAGGLNAAGETLRSVYVFDAARGWSKLSEAMPFRTACGGGAVVDERLYVFGGRIDPSMGTSCQGFRASSGMLVFDPMGPEGKQWTQGGDGPIPWPHCAYRLTSIGHIVHVVGGGGCGPALPSAFPYEFDTRQRRWRSTSASVGGTWWPGVSRVGDFLITFGGRDGDLWYNPAQMMYARGVTTMGAGPMPSLPDGLLDAPSVDFRGDLVIAGGANDATYRAMSDVTRLRLTSGCDLYESDDRVADAAALPVIPDRSGEVLPWSTTLGRICHRDDVDYIRLLGFLQNISAGGVRLTPPPGTDYQLTLLDSAGTRVIARSSRVGSVPESLPLPSDASSYLLRIESQDGTFDARRPYTLRLVR